MHTKDKKRLSQTVDLAKVMTNIYNNDLLLSGLLNETGKHRINTAARFELVNIHKTTKSQITRLERCFTPEYLNIIKAQLTDNNIVLQTDGAVDSFLKLSVNNRNFVEELMSEDITASVSNDKEKSEQILLRMELYDLLKNASKATINTLLVTAKGLVKL